jgi:2-oxoisovalerate dehydrogenase E2 component (dihydrolipoyl transacylase)
MGMVIAEIEVEGEEPSTEAAPQAATEQPEKIDTTGVLLKDVSPGGPTGSGGPMNAVAPEVSDAPAGTGRQRYSPAVQRLAEEHDVDLSLVVGTGMGARVTRKDVQAFIETRPSTEPSGGPAAALGPDEERVPLTPVRRMIADNMVISSSQIPQAWSTVEVDVTGLVLKREGARSDFQQREGVNLTYLPFVLKAVAESLRENPLLNSSWAGDAVLLKHRINIGVAVAAPIGLVVPVVHDADRLSIAGLATALADLTGRARQGKLELKDVQGGTFTVNNTGALGSVVSRPLVNPPQAAILATESIVKRPVVIGDAIAIRSVMNLCLTFDHRVMDGAESSAFIGSVKRLLEAVGPDTPIY